MKVGGDKSSLKIQRRQLLICATVVLLSIGRPSAEQSHILNRDPPGVKNREKRSIEEEQLQVDKEKLAAETELERRRLEIERTRLELDKAAAKWSTIGPAIPLLVALLTLAYSIWSFGKQGKQQIELKAMEFVFQGKTPEALQNRCRAMVSLLGGRLPKDFGSTFSPVDHGGGKEDPESKKFFLELLLKYPTQRNETLQYWRALFGDAWLDRVHPDDKVALNTDLQGDGPLKNNKERSRSDSVATEV